MISASRGIQWRQRGGLKLCCVHMFYPHVNKYVKYCALVRGAPVNPEPTQAYQCQFQRSACERGGVH
eukprot:14167746-Heterocapsa_arctica.AAC.1